MTPPYENLEQIGGASVLEYVKLDASVIRTGKTKHTVQGEVRNDFCGLAICQYPGESGYYLFYCDRHWKEVTDAWFDSIEAAKKQAAFEYTGIHNRWLRAKPSV